MLWCDAVRIYFSPHLQGKARQSETVGINPEPTYPQTNKHAHTLAHLDQTGDRLDKGSSFPFKRRLQVHQPRLRLAVEPQSPGGAGAEESPQGCGAMPRSQKKQSTGLVHRKDGVWGYGLGRRFEDEPAANGAHLECVGQ